MTEKEIRSKVVEIAKGWLGCKESDVVIPCYHLVWYNREHKSPRTTGIRGDFI